MWSLSRAVVGLTAGRARCTPPVSEPAPSWRRREHADCRSSPQCPVLTRRTSRLRIGLEPFQTAATMGSPKDISASGREGDTGWCGGVGLAATYDRHRRLRVGHQRRRAAIRLGAKPWRSSNNQGYSYMLRGKYPEARKSPQGLCREPHQPDGLEPNLQLRDGRTRDTPPPSFGERPLSRARGLKAPVPRTAR